MIHLDWVFVVWSVIVAFGLGTIAGLVVPKRGERR